MKIILLILLISLFAGTNYLSFKHGAKQGFLSKIYLDHKILKIAVEQQGKCIDQDKKECIRKMNETIRVHLQHNKFEPNELEEAMKKSIELAKSAKTTE